LRSREHAVILAAMKIAALILALLSAAAHAELKWDTSRQQFEYEPGKPVFRAQFGFVNKGKSTARITSVKSGCTCCTSAKADKTVFAPGERGAIAVKVDLRGKQVPIMKPVIVGTDDGKFATLLIEVSPKDGVARNVPKWGK
jgi:hypothetical protein